MNVSSAAVALLLALPQSAATTTAIHSTATLAAAIVHQDDAFTRAYNDCATTRLRTMFTVSAEVVVGEQGVTQQIGKVIDQIRRHHCGRLRREVDRASVEVYPLPGYGALQFGSERYCPGAGACDSVPSRYLVVWRRFEDGWKIARLIRFSEQP
jgi:ketosteroid isomerase-like protein